MMRTTNLAIAGLCLVVTIAATRSQALAQAGIPNCEDLPNPVFMSGTTAVLPVIRNFGAKLKKVGVTLLWNENSEGCGSVQDLAFPASNFGRTIFSQYDEVVSGVTSKVAISTCLPKTGTRSELVINDTFWASCPAAQGSSANLPATLKEFSGPVQGLVPVVASSYLYYSEITSQELQDLYMCGAKGKILTFSNAATIYDYNCQTSGMRELWVRGLGLVNGRALPGAVGEGCNTNSNAESMVTTYVAPTITPDTTIGYTSTEFYDENRDKVRAFKVRGVNQLKAYLPDADLTSNDKINIREGRYTIQGALKLVAVVDANGVPVSAGAKKIIDWLLDNPLSDPSLTLPFDLNQIYAQHGVVPQCAMRVTKSADEPVFRHYRHPMPCHCSFEMLATGKASPGCTPCTDSSTCGAKVCSHGYCE
jgi:ABC-type phosphate transport system substrate-binding protein